MKKLLCMILALSMLFAFAACGSNEEPTNAPSSEVPSTDAPSTEEPTEAPSSEEPTEAPTEASSTGAAAVLENIWATYEENEKFFAMGGGYANMVDGAPGTISMDEAPGILIFDAAEVANMDDAASLVHAMNANTFTCGVFHLTDASHTADFAESTKACLDGNQWICGFPETMLIMDLGDGYVLSAFGAADIMELFKTKTVSCYADAAILVEGPVA